MYIPLHTKPPLDVEDNTDRTPLKGNAYTRDLIERLRNEVSPRGMRDPIEDLVEEAANELERLTSV